MRLIKLTLIVFSIINLGCTSHSQKRWIEIVEPTVQQEATSIWRTINDISFFEKQGYTINLPKGSLIDSLIAKSKKGTFGNDDFSAIYAFVESKVFNQKSYKKARQKVENQVGLLNNLVNEIDTKKSEWDWKFKMFDTYKIVFTLYGTGGSYNPNEGVITLLTTNEGGFMRYKNPAYTIIHEITHIGMEYSLVQKYHLPHGLKERLVDTFVYLMFKEELPDYQIQNMGDKNIDRYLSTKKDIASLNSTLKEFIKK